MKPVAICKSLLSRHKTNDAIAIPSWTEWLDEHGIPWEYVDCYDTDIISKLPNYSGLIWHYENYSNADLMEAQNILDIAASMGLKVYPDHNTAWHFDDKIAEMYALQAVGAPIPKSWVFYELETCLKWLENECKYPIVAKLRRGSGSNNVKLLKNYSEAKKYAKRMFGEGVSPAQSIVYKTFSKVQTVTVTNLSPLNLSVSLNRINALLTIQSTDARPAGISKIRTTFAKGGMAFNPSTGQANVDTGFSQTNTPNAAVGTTITVNSCPLLASADDEEEKMDLTIEVLDTNDKVLFTKVVSDVPFKRNNQTTLSGPLFTASPSSLSFTLNTDWGPGYTVTF